MNQLFKILALSALPLSLTSIALPIHSLPSAEIIISQSIQIKKSLSRMNVFIHRPSSSSLRCNKEYCEQSVSFLVDIEYQKKVSYKGNLVSRDIFTVSGTCYKKDDNDQKCRTVKYCPPAKDEKCQILRTEYNVESRQMVLENGKIINSKTAQSLPSHIAKDAFDFVSNY